MNLLLNIAITLFLVNINFSLLFLGDSLPCFSNKIVHKKVQHHFIVKNSGLESIINIENTYIVIKNENSIVQKKSNLKFIYPYKPKKKIKQPYIACIANYEFNLKTQIKYLFKKTEKKLKLSSDITQEFTNSYHIKKTKVNNFFAFIHKLQI